MNKYRDKSDFEINKAVAVALGKVIGIRPDSNIIYLIGGDELIEFSPCNNPADAMPIVFENKINLKHLANNTNNLVLANHKEYWCIRKNPYRAAMEVFLMINDAENEK
ncbi:phage protein NinX family protein [Morganella morganii]|uniref:phage protein NinX family protein n=1 Tax=Morganella morganii TaxID=582 RepID=UPI0034E3794E